MQNSVAMETARLEIRLFGSFSACVGSRALPPLRSRAEKRLLMLLALRAGSAVSRDWLSATLWPDSEAALGLYNLRRCLTQLRKALGDQADIVLSPTPQTLCLDRAGLSVDMIAFDAAIAEGRLEGLEKAVGLYRGPLLEECLEEWALTARIEREQAYLAALETLAEHAASQGQLTASVRYLRLTIAADPLREAAYAALMQRLADCGDFAAMTQVYRDLRLLLHRELNLTPSTETEALYRNLQLRAKQTVLPAVLPQDALAAPSLRRLPVPPTDLIGRESDVEEVVDWIHKARLVTLLGVGGLGKTRLAIAAAEATAADFSDGVWFIELASQTDPVHVVEVVARTLGVKEETRRPLLETLAAAMAFRSALLILDNCEHLIEACASLAETLLSQSNTLRVLATSREALGLVGEYRFHTPALALPQEEASERSAEGREKDLAWLMEYGAMRLFVERAMQVQPTFRLTPHNAASLLRIVRHLDGIPLAIELAAARVRSLAVTEIEARLHTCIALLGGGHRTALPRHRTLHALLSWSYDLLSEDEQRLLERLSVFRGGWTLEAAEAVCLERPGDTSAFVDLLTALVDKSLVVYEDANGETRYRLLETVRQYAGERLEALGENLAYRRRHRDHYLAFAEGLHQSLPMPDLETSVNRLDPEHDNLRQALAFCLAAEEEASFGLRLGAALERFWHMRLYLQEAREFMTALLAKPGATDYPSLRAEVLCGLSKQVSLQGDYDLAWPLAEESREIHLALGDRKLYANALVSLGLIACRKGEFDSARAYQQQALEIRREIGDCWGVAYTLNHLAECSWLQGDYPTALALNKQSLAGFREVGNRRGIGNSLSLQGLILWHLGEYTASHAFHEESLRIREEAGDRYGAALSYSNLGNIALSRGDAAASRALQEESLTRFRALGNRKGIALALGNLANAITMMGDYDAARRAQQETLTISQTLGDRHGMAHALSNLGALAIYQRDFVSGRAFLEESLAIRREMGDLRGIAHCLGNLGHVAMCTGDYAFARALWDESLTMRQTLGDRDGVAHTLSNLASLAIRQGDAEAAYTLQQESLRLFREIEDRDGIAVSLETFADLFLFLCRFEVAARFWGSAERLREEIGMPMPLNQQEEYQEAVARARAALAEPNFAVARQAGREMTVEQAAEYASENRP